MGKAAGVEDLAAVNLDELGCSASIEHGPKQLLTVELLPSTIDPSPLQFCTFLYPRPGTTSSIRNDKFTWLK